VIRLCLCIIRYAQRGPWGISRWYAHRRVPYTQMKGALIILATESIAYICYSCCIPFLRFDAVAAIVIIAKAVDDVKTSLLFVITSIIFNRSY
jgi:uncharacterized protein (DUF486 family)